MRQTCIGEATSFSFGAFMVEIFAGLGELEGDDGDGTTESVETRGAVDNNFLNIFIGAKASNEEKMK